MSVAMTLVIFAAVSSVLLPAVRADAVFISATCNKTKDPVLCVAVLTADPRSAKATSVQDFTRIAAGIATDTALDRKSVV